MNRKTSNRLRVLRAEKRWPQMEVAERAGMGLNRYWKIENERAEPEPSERKKIAKALGVTEAEAFPSSDVVGAA